MEIDVRETIGRSIWTTGVYDLAVVEILMRLADHRRLAIDAGANIGAMTSAMAASAAEVWAFEPNPLVGRRLSENVGRFAMKRGFAPCHVFDIALSDIDGDGRLEVPYGSASNHGLGRMTDTDSGFAVRTARLDTFLTGREVGVLKVDVEGHELSVFQGASESLKAGRISNIVFEDHDGANSPACRFLTGIGYTLFEISWRMSGPRIAAPGTKTHRRYEAPSYLATLHPNDAIAACRPRGWRCFKPPASPTQ
jgi:FkbM family methyltransferase